MTITTIKIITMIISESHSNGTSIDIVIASGDTAKTGKRETEKKKRFESKKKLRSAPPSPCHSRYEGAGQSKVCVCREEDDDDEQDGQRKSERKDDERREKGKERQT